jgi:hypothetical protein
MAGIAILMTAVAGCATTETTAARVMKPGDFKMLAGKWTGSLYVEGQQPAAIEAVVEDTGAFNFRPISAAGAQTAGQMRIVDGGVMYETPTSKGTMTFHEGDKGWTWKWQGKSADAGQTRAELTKSK